MYQIKTVLQKAIGAIKILPNKTPSEIDRVLSLYSLKRKDISMFTINAKDIESSDAITRYAHIPENADLPDNELLASLAGDFESGDGQTRYENWTAVQSKKGKSYAFQIK